jgi:hypothetical protein
MEFAIVVPVLLLILFGTIEFARAWNNKDTLVHIANEAARMAAVNNVNCARLTGEASADGLPGPTVVFTTPSGAAIGSPVQVDISHGFTQLALNVPGLPATLSATASMRLEQAYTGPASCP